MRPDDLTGPELRLWEAFAAGGEVDLRPRGPVGGAVVDGGSWGPEREVRASVVRSLLLGGADAISGETPMVHLVGARISGKLRLVFAEVCCVLWLEECWFEEAPQWYGATLRVTSFGGSFLPGLGMGATTVDGNLDLMNCRVQGRADVHDARISGSLLLQGAHLSYAGDVALDGARLEAKGVVGTGGLRADGELRLLQARLSDGLHLRGAALHQPGGEALSASGIQVSTTIDCGEGFRADGAVTLSGATVGGSVSFDAASLTPTRGNALSCPHLQAGELLLRPARATGGMDLRHAAIGVLRFHDDGHEQPPLQLEPGAGVPADGADPMDRLAPDRRGLAAGHGPRRRHHPGSLPLIVRGRSGTGAAKGCQAAQRSHGRVLYAGKVLEDGAGLYEALRIA